MESVKLPILCPKEGISHIRHCSPYKLSFLSCQVHFVTICCVNWLHAVLWMEQQQKKECQSRIDPPCFPTNNRKCKLTELVHFRLTSHSSHKLEHSWSPFWTKIVQKWTNTAEQRSVNTQTMREGDSTRWEKVQTKAT